MSAPPLEPQKRPSLSLAFALSAPVFALYAAQSLHAPADGSTFSGFIHFDMPTYIANARQYPDGDAGWVFYSNPYDFEPGAPRIYFQPVTWLLGLGLGLLPPAPLFLGLGFATTVAAFYLLQALIDRLMPSLSGGRRLLAILFTAWGGGALTLGTLLHGRMLDPAGGMWFLNLGRNFIYPLEAHHHLLVVALLLALVSGRLRIGAALLWLIVLNHPFTGAQYGAMVCAWALLERVALRSGAVDTRAALLLSSPLLWVVGYYLFYLPSFPVHAQLMRQWSIDWSLEALSALYAWGPVAGLALLAQLRRGRATRPAERLLMVSALVSFALVHHGLVVTPMQPLHFTRGHVFLPLCLLGLPALAAAADAVARLRPLSRVLLLAAALPLLFADNLSFFAYKSGRPMGVFLSAGERETFEWLGQAAGRPLLFSDDRQVRTYAPTWSSLRPYAGHWANTPFAREREAAVDALLETGQLPAASRGEALVAVVRGDAPGLLEAGFREVHATAAHRIYRRDPPP